MKFNSQFGGAALEYILVTTFAAILSIGALGAIGKTIKEKIDKIQSTLESQNEWDPFED